MSGVEYWGEKGASDGMITDSKGTIYAGDYENNSIRKTLPNGKMETIAQDSKIYGPDTFPFAIGPDQYFYVIVHQYIGGKISLWKRSATKPYSLIRMSLVC